MIDKSLLSPLPTVFGPRAACDIVDRAKVTLASLLPGCTARRYDMPTHYEDYRPVDLCFGGQGPIVPKLGFKCSKYYDWISPVFYYVLMLRSPQALGTTFGGLSSFPGNIRLHAGPQAIASTVSETLAKFDFAGLIAGGTVERILADEPRVPVPGPNFNLALCAVYLGKNEEANQLLNDDIESAKKDGRAAFADLIVEAETCITKLGADPMMLRQELIATMNDNWSHFKIVDTV
jgi:hypothetical protein